MTEKPVAEVLVEGELSPFEDEALYRLLKKGFQVSPPSYSEISYDEDLTTRVNIVFHHPYTPEFFTQHLREDWRSLKDLIKQVRQRRGGAGAAFTLTFVSDDFRLVFRSGQVDHEEIVSAMDQIGHLTGIIGRIIQADTLPERLGSVECRFDKSSDRWQDFRGTSLENQDRAYRFDEAFSRWDPVKS